ncbi:type VI secretion system tube protein TssD, partial [Aquimarina hainanensis]
QPSLMKKGTITIYKYDLSAVETTINFYNAHGLHYHLEFDANSAQAAYIDFRIGAGELHLNELIHENKWNPERHQALVTPKEIHKANDTDSDIKKDESIQRYPNKINFNNVETKEDKERLLSQTIEWFGFVKKFGRSMNIHPASVIDFYSAPETEKSFTEKLINTLENMIGGDSDDHHNVDIPDDIGNFVRIGYFKNVRDHADIYSATSVHFQGNHNAENKYRISIRSHDIGSGTPQAIVYMFFTGQNRKFYEEITTRINAYEYTKVKITPHKKQ